MSKLKNKKAFVCTECGSESPKWQGQCADCRTWNSYKEINLGAKSSALSAQKHVGFAGANSAIESLSNINIKDTPRFSSGINEFDRVLGGGFVCGSTVLIGGHPGAGKSTILLQVLCHLSHTMNTLYVSGEESMQQIAARANRLELPSGNIQILTETSAEQIVTIATEHKPGIIVIDSIQVMYMNGLDAIPGGVSQVRESAAFLTRFAKKTGTVLLIVGHITKDNSLAGPMTLSHIIDTQIMLGNTDDARFRVMRATKNRFGQVNELGIFAMTEKGLLEVKNPSAIFLSRTPKAVSGSIISVLWEGTRALLVEIQALVADSQLGNPRRVTVGIDHNRLSMLLAVLTRHGNIFTSDQDVFLNVVGGIRVAETSADLPSLLAVISSLQDKPLPQKLFSFGEVGLAGEIRPVSNGLERLIEAVKHGFTHAIIPAANKPKKEIAGLTITSVHKLTEVLIAL